VDFGIEQRKRFLGTPDRIHGVTEAGEEPLGRKPAIVNVIDEQHGRVRNTRVYSELVHRFSDGKRFWV
jgi:hypothetical protein